MVLPGYVTGGGGTVMTCSYQLSPGQWVDSVKWYLNSSEIYRIVPSLTLQDRSVYSHFPSFLGMLTVDC